MEGKSEERNTTLLIKTEGSLSISQVSNIERHSNIKRLERVTALVIRFIRNCCTQERKISERLTIEELVNARMLWVLDAQRQAINEPKFEQRTADFGLVQGNDSLVSCHRRLGKSGLSEDAKRPILLPGKHPLTNLIIQQCHEIVGHGGVARTLAEVRSKYWIIKGQQVVRKIIKGCWRCKRFLVKRLQDNQTSQLPSFRVNQSRPFQYTGVDFTGPLHIRNGKEEKKAYITLFTCAVTRAVHLELAKGLTAAEFRRNLEKFVARRGTPNLLVSDNAATFKAVSVDLEEIYNHPEVREYLDEIYVQWQFNLALAAWWGGFFERIVGLVKTILRRMLGKAKLGFKELEVVLAKTEAILNNRPLTYQGQDLEEEPSTPNHLIYGCKLPQMVEEPEDCFDEKVDLDRRRKYVEQKLSNVWNRWHREYLVGLREAHKMKMDQGNTGLPSLLVSAGESRFFSISPNLPEKLKISW